MNRLNKIVIVFAATLCLTALSAYAQMSSQATVTDMKGEAKFLKSGSTEWLDLEKGATLSEGDTVRTAKDSQVQILMAGASKTAEITVRPETEFVFKTFNHEESKENTLLDVQLGGVLVKAEKLVGESKFEVKTPTSIVGIRGTTFEVQVSKS